MQEEKSIEIRLVKAIESRTVQTESFLEIKKKCGVWSLVVASFMILIFLEKKTKESDSLVGEVKK